MNRREFSKYVLAGGASMFAPRGYIDAAGAAGSPPQQDSTAKFDLLIKGGTVIDPGQQINAPMDVAVRDGKIVDVSANIAGDRAVKVVSAKDRIVAPGFIDLHAHCFDGVGIGMNADHSCLGRGVTTMVDAGSAGYATFPAFRKYVINTSNARIVALINIGAVGTAMSAGALLNLDWVNPQLTAKMAIDNKPAVVGIKVQLSTSITGPNDMECLKRALEAAEIAGLPLMAHIDESYSPLPGILKLLRKGDIFTHCYNNHTHGILDANGKIIPEALEARGRGVIFDPAQGQSHLSFDVAEKCMQQNFYPDTISTDLTVMSADRRVFDLPTMVGKFMAIGIPLDKAIGMVTINPSRVFNYGAQIGTLRLGSDADISIFEVREGKFEFEDSDGAKRTGQKILVNKSVVRHGQLIVNSV